MGKDWQEPVQISVQIDFFENFPSKYADAAPDIVADVPCHSPDDAVDYQGLNLIPSRIPSRPPPHDHHVVIVQALHQFGQLRRIDLVIRRERHDDLAGSVQEARVDRDRLSEGSRMFDQRQLLARFLQRFQLQVCLLEIPFDDVDELERSARLRKGFLVFPVHLADVVVSFRNRNDHGDRFQRDLLIRGFLRNYGNVHVTPIRSFLSVVRGP